MLVAVVLVVVLVVGIGVGIGAEVETPDPARPADTVPEQVQRETETRYRSLAGAARAAASGDPAPAARELLLTIAADLEVQADGVALPRPPDSPESPDFPAAPTLQPGSSPGTAPADPGPTPAAPSVDGPELLGQLRASARTSLADVVDADPGPARVLASAGANQWQRALELGAALGADPEPPPLAPAWPATPPGTGRTGDCAGAPPSPDADREALQSALATEDRAVYGYEVAAALLPDRAVLLDRAAEHRTAADTASDRLVQLCRTPVPTAPGSTLTPAFRADPSGALLRLEQQQVELYAQQVATTGPDTRAWAAAALTAAVVRAAAAGAPVQPLPGIAGVSDD